MPKDSLFRMIMTVMVASVMVGTLMAVAGEYYFYSPAIKQVGVGAALISGAVYFFFRWLGRREAEREAKEQRQELLRGRDDAQGGDHEDRGESG